MHTQVKSFTSCFKKASEKLEAVKRGRAVFTCLNVSVKSTWVSTLLMTISPFFLFCSFPALHFSLPVLTCPPFLFPSSPPYLNHFPFSPFLPLSLLCLLFTLPFPSIAPSSPPYSLPFPSTAPSSLPSPLSPLPPTLSSSQGSV